MKNDKLKTVLVLAKKYIEKANYEAVVNLDDIMGELYMDGAQYEIMQETSSLIQNIDILLAKH